jgi:hypothetical protein
MSLLTHYSELMRLYTYQVLIAKGASEMEASMATYPVALKAAAKIEQLPEDQQRRKLQIDIACLEVLLGLAPAADPNGMD